MNKHATSEFVEAHFGSILEDYDSEIMAHYHDAVRSVETQVVPRIHDLEDFIAEVAELPCDPTLHRLNGQCVPCAARYRLAKAAE